MVTIVTIASSTTTNAPCSGESHAPGVCFLTDVEGNWEYFTAFVERSEGLSFTGGQPRYHDDGACELTLHEGWCFVHGGDSCDKGGAVGGSVRVVRTLVALKNKYPDRVTLILGNRDLNKMRWSAQLAFERGSYDAQTGFATWNEWNTLERVDGPCWVADDAKRAAMTPMAYYRKLLAKEKGVKPEEVSDADALLIDTVANRIRWHFKEMMGADGEFERRRLELTFLKRLHDAHAAEATEADVVWSTVASVEEGGFMREYIELGSLAHVHRNCLYMHGGIVGGGCKADEHAVGAVPGSDERIDDVHEWVAALNQWKSTQVAEWIETPSWSGASLAEHVVELRLENDETSIDIPPSVPTAQREVTRWKTLDGCTLRGGGQALQDYGLFTDGPTVVLGRHLQKTGMPMSVPDEAMDLLNKGGIRRVVVGHTPHGTCPTIIKAGGPGMQEPGLVVVMADTSFSDMKAADNRGSAVSEVQLLDNGEVRVHGVLPDRRELCYTLPDGVGGDAHPELVGWDVPPSTGAVARAIGKDVREMLGKDGFFVKAFLESEAEQLYLLQHVNGFVNKYVYLRPNEVKRMFEAQLEALMSGGTLGEDEHDKADEPTIGGEGSSSMGGSAMEGAASQTASNRRAQVTMHLLGDEEALDGNERHEYALQEFTKQMEMFLEENSEGGVATPGTTNESRISKHLVPTRDNMQHIMKAVLVSTNL